MGAGGGEFCINHVVEFCERDDVIGLTLAKNVACRFALLLSRFHSSLPRHIISDLSFHRFFFFLILFLFHLYEIYYFYNLLHREKTNLNFILELYTIYLIYRNKNLV